MDLRGLGSLPRGVVAGLAGRPHKVLVGRGRLADRSGSTVVVVVVVVVVGVVVVVVVVGVAVW
jgi:hypothetical protein